MSKTQCAFGCKDVEMPLFHLPHYRDMDRLLHWIKLIDGEVGERVDYVYYRKKRVCNKHFTPADKINNRQLKVDAIPSVSIPGQPATFNPSLLIQKRPHASSGQIKTLGQCYAQLVLPEYSWLADLPVSVRDKVSQAWSGLLDSNYDTSQKPTLELQNLNDQILIIKQDSKSDKICDSAEKQNNKGRSSKYIILKKVESMNPGSLRHIENIQMCKSDHSYFRIAFHNDHSYVKEGINVPAGDASFKKEIRHLVPIPKTYSAKKTCEGEGETTDATPSGKDAEDVVQTDQTTEEPSAVDDDGLAPFSPVPVPEPEGAGTLFSWQKSELIPADDVEEPPSISELEDQNGISLYCDDTPPPSVPQVPEANHKEVEYLCKDCGKIIDGFQFWCVQCFGCALCGACEARGEHKRHYVLRAPPDRPYRQTQVVLATIRHQLQNENLLTQLGTDDDGVKLEVKEEPPEEECRIVDAAPPPDPLDAADPLRPEPAPAHEHRPAPAARSLLITDLSKYTGLRPVKRPRLADFIERDFAAAPRGAPLAVTVTSRPRPQEQILINLDEVDDQVEYVVEESETDDVAPRDDEFTEIEHLDEDTDSDSISEDDYSIERLDEDDDDSIERIDEDDADNIERIDEHDADGIERIDEHDADSIERIDEHDADRIDEDETDEVTRIVNETDGVDARIAEEVESILSDLVAQRGVRRQVETGKLPLRGTPESMARTLSSEAVVELQPLSSLEIRKWTADSKKRRK